MGPGAHFEDYPACTLEPGLKGHTSGHSREVEALSLNSGWTHGGIFGIPTQGIQACIRVISAWTAGLTMCGQTALSCISVPSRVFMRFQRKQRSLDLFRCRTRRDEIFIGSMPRKNRLPSLARSNTSHLLGGILTAELPAFSTLHGLPSCQAPWTQCWAGFL